MMSPAVLIVEDDPHFRAALSGAVREASDMQLVGAADDLPEGLRLLEQHRPDVLLVDLGLPGGSGIDLIRRAKCRSSEKLTIGSQYLTMGNRAISSIHAAFERIDTRCDLLHGSHNSSL